MIDWIRRQDALIAGLITRWGVPVFAFGTRCYVAWQFFKSGLLKVGSWESTLFLFQYEYHVPVLPPVVAAWVGAFGELVFPPLLVAGIATRYAAIGLQGVNVMAVISYADVLLASGNEAALGDHILWGYMLLVPLFYGSGPIGLDRWLGLQTR